MTDQQVKLSIGAVAIAPNNPNVIYAGLGENSFAIDSTPGLGILRSDDGGTTWVRTSYNFQNSYNNGPSTYALAEDPTNSAVVLAALSSGLFRSTDSGTTWTNVLAQPSTAILFDKNDPNTLYAGINSVYTSATYSSSVYKSTDKGATWSPLGIGNLPPSNTVIGTSLAQNTNGGTLYAVWRRATTPRPGCYISRPTAARLGPS